MLRRSLLVVAISLFCLQTFQAHAEELGDVVKGTWNWTCCKDGVYSGQIQITDYNPAAPIDSQLTGTFNGAGGGSIVGHVDGNRIHFRRTSSACEPGIGYQDWVGTYDPSPRTISGTIDGCNVRSDPNIQGNNSFTMTKTP